MPVPPLHSVTYSVNLGKSVVDYTILSDLRFTKCTSAFHNVSDDDLYIYLYDVPGATTTSAGHSCFVEFGAAEYTGAAMHCNKAAKLMSSQFGTYVPVCNRETPAQWEPCQCGFGANLVKPTCVCVDADSGHPLEGAEMAVVDTSEASEYSHYSDWCEDHCPNSHYPGLTSQGTTSGHSAMVNSESTSPGTMTTEHDGESAVNTESAGQFNWRLLNTLVYVFIFAGMMIIVMGFIHMWKQLCPHKCNRAYKPVITSETSYGNDCL